MDDARFEGDAGDIGDDFASRDREYPPRPRPDPPPPPRRRPGADKLTEAGAAERFARECGDQLRHDHRRERWLVWAGHSWRSDDDAAVQRIVLEFARQWQKDAVDQVDEPDLRKKVQDHARRIEKRDGANGMLYWAKALKPITSCGDAWDTDPWLLGTPSGVVDLRTGRRRDGKRGDAISMQTETPFDEGATCPRWEQFIAEVFGDDEDLRDFVHRAVGYSLTGVTTEQVLFMLYGTGANGKGTFTNTLLRVLGDYAWNMPFTTIELRDRASIPNDLAALVGRRFVSASETSDGTRLNEGRVKALTGCDPVTARFLHSEFFTFRPVAKFWLSVNHKPVVRDDSYGFWRRIRLISFERTFEVNKGLQDELLAEAPGILAWAVRGCLAWRARGLAPPSVVMRETTTYQDESDPLAEFLNEACEADEHATVPAHEMYLHWQAWAKRRGLNERDRDWFSATRFGRKLSERLKKKRTETGTVYCGVARRDTMTGL